MAGRHRKDGPAAQAGAGGTTLEAPEDQDPASPGAQRADSDDPALRERTSLQLAGDQPGTADRPAARPAAASPWPQLDLGHRTAVAVPAGAGKAAEAAPVLPAGSTGRKAAREQVRRRSRNIRLVLAAAVLAVLAVVAYVVVRSGANSPAALPGPAARPQTTLLLQVVDGSRQTLGGVLLAHDTRGQGTGYGALIPGALVVDVPGYGSAPFSATSADTSPDSSALAVADTVGVTVDGTWVLDTVALATLVDSVGGVDVTVDRDVTAPVAGGTQIITPAGPHHLAGAAAAAFATFLAAQEPDQARLARLSTVLQALLAKLPADAKARAATLASLAGHATSTLPPSTLDTFLAGLRADAVGQRLSFDTLPTRSLDLGTGTPTLLIDPGPLQTLVRNNFSGSVPTARRGGDIRVLIQNGVGTPGLSAKARAKLLIAGLTYVGGGNAAAFGYPRSQVLVPTGAGSTGIDQGHVVARALGLPAADVLLTDQGQTIADVVVILGADFKP